MTLKSRTVPLRSAGERKVSSEKGALWVRHKDAIDKVLAEAKSFSDDRQRKLKRLDQTKVTPEPKRRP